MKEGKRAHTQTHTHRATWEATHEAIWVRVIVSQKLPGGEGESIFAARHLDVSQDLLGKCAKEVLGKHFGQDGSPLSGL